MKKKCCLACLGVTLLSLLRNLDPCNILSGDLHFFAVHSNICKCLDQDFENAGRPYDARVMYVFEARLFTELKTWDTLAYSICTESLVQMVKNKSGAH